MATVEVKNDAFVVRDEFYSGWEQWVLLQSDEHFDSVKCDRKLLKRHHEEAKERNALIFKFGDFFDCMGGKWDKRSNKEDVRPEYQKANYFDCIKKDAANFLYPYRNNIAVIAPGNHEASVLARHEIDLTGHLAEQLGVKMGKYCGFVRFQFKHKAGGSNKRSFVLYYTHGSGGGAPVTKGVIKNNRRQHTIISDIYVSGHIHTGTIQTRPRVHLSEQCKVKQSEPEHIILGTYKNDFLTGGWADSKEFDPPVMGGVWLRFYYHGMEVKFDTIRAK